MRGIKVYLIIPPVTTVTITAYYWVETEKLIYSGIIRGVMVEKKDIVGIKISRETREKLKAIGIKGDTYEDVLCDLLELEADKRSKE